MLDALCITRQTSLQLKKTLPECSPLIAIYSTRCTCSPHIPDAGTQTHQSRDYRAHLRPDRVSFVELLHDRADIYPCSNTPTLATMLRINKSIYKEARKHLYHTLELGYAGNPSSSNDFNAVVKGFLEGSTTATECLALIHTIFVGGKVPYGHMQGQDKAVFPNLHTVILPQAAQRWPDIFGLEVFRSAKHLVLRDAPVGIHLFDCTRVCGLNEPKHGDIACWTQLGKISFYDLAARSSLTAVYGKGLEVIPTAFKRLEEIVIWPAFDDTERHAETDVFENLPDANRFQLFKRFKVVVPIGLEDEYMNGYERLLRNHNLPDSKSALVTYTSADHKVVDKMDPVLNEARQFREWQ